MLSCFTVQTVVAKSYIAQNNRTLGRVGVESYFTIDARDSCGFPRREGGDSWTLTLLKAQSVYTYAIPSNKITNIGDGTYRAYFTVAQSGYFTVRASQPGQTATNIGGFSVQPA